MIIRIFFFVCISIVMVGCQFTETLVLHEDGSGTMAVEVNMNEMMGFSGMGIAEGEEIKMDTLIFMKRFLEEKKDSIANLSQEEQMKLKKLENFNIHIKMDSEKSEMMYTISTVFNSVDEANDIVNGLGEVNNFMPATNEENMEKDNSSDIIGVNYSFKQGKFTRDAYIKDKKLHQQEVDSLKQSEAFLGGIGYTLKYSFPRPIKKTSDPAATLSGDKKTLTLQKPFVDYFKNPDILDLEVELEE